MNEFVFILMPAETHTVLLYSRSHWWSVIKVPARKNDKSSKKLFIFFIDRDNIKTISSVSCDMLTKYTVHEQATIRQLLFLSLCSLLQPAFLYLSSLPLSTLRSFMILYLSLLVWHTPLSDREDPCTYTASIHTIYINSRLTKSAVISCYSAALN